MHIGGHPATASLIPWRLRAISSWLPTILGVGASSKPCDGRSRVARDNEPLASVAADARIGRGPGFWSSAMPLVQAESEYESLRAELRALNAQHGWATDDEFETQMPTIASRQEVRALNEQLLPPGSGASGPEPAELVRLLLLDLAGWATGVGLAGQTFDAAPPDG